MPNPLQNKCCAFCFKFKDYQIRECKNCPCHKEEVKYGTELGSRIYCEDCGENKSETKDLRGYCQGHLKENLPPPEREEWRKDILALAEDPDCHDMLIGVVESLLQSKEREVVEEIINHIGGITLSQKPLILLIVGMLAYTTPYSKYKSI